jgi:hypothetical protein
MSLGLFAATVVLLQEHKALSVERLAHLLGVQPGIVVGILTDIHAQGHCTLYQIDGQMQRATWIDQPEGVQSCA